MVKGMADVINVFNFLKEFNDLSNPVITDIDYQKWNLSIKDIPKIDEIKSVFHGHEMTDADYLEVKRPEILSCPKPPAELLEWFVSDWRKTKIEIVETQEMIIRKSEDEEGNLVEEDEHFEDSPERVETFNIWVGLRNKWREETIPKEKGLQLYNRLFELYSDMKKESESVELILGDGHIRWQTDGRIINHPVLLQRVKLAFEADIPAFKVYSDEQKLDLYTPMLRVIPSINQKMLSDIIQDVDNSDYEIVEDENTKGLFERIINVIDVNGKYIEERQGIGSEATIQAAPVLFLRKRTLGFSNFIEGIIEEIESGFSEQLGGFWGVMTGHYEEKEDRPIIESNWNYSGIDKDVLLTLPANNEQLRIIKYLDQYGAVLVQGPPGTGKTHTIANLIGHLLSQGSSVLVTSHTEKALSVLKEKVFKDPNDPNLNLQNLCISLLSSTSQKKEMDEAINELATKSSSLDVHSTEEKILRLEKERANLISQSQELTQTLRRVRAQTYQDLVYNHSTISPIDAGKFLYQGVNKYDYITGKSNHDELGIPLTNEELVYLYASNSYVNLDEESLIRKSYPSMDQFLSSVAYSELVNRKVELEKTITDSFIDEFYCQLDQNTKEQIILETQKILSVINGFEMLEQAIINKTISDPLYSKLWEEIIDKINNFEPAYESYRKLNLKHDFEIHESLYTVETLRMLEEILKTEKEKPVSFFSKGDWKKLRDTLKVNGKSLDVRTDYELCREVVAFEVEKRQLINMLSKLLSEIMDVTATTFEDFEGKLMRYRQRILDALDWYSEVCKPYLLQTEEKIQMPAGEGLKRVATIRTLEDCQVLLNCTVRILNLDLNKEELSKLERTLADYILLLSTFNTDNSLIQALIDAAQGLNNLNYEKALQEIYELIQKNEVVTRRAEYIARIREIAPQLAIDIEERKAPYESTTTPDQFENAWKYFQLKNQMERLDAVNPKTIQDELEQINSLLIKNARVLAYEKAWHQKIINQTAEENQALQGWRSTIKLIGKDKGKNAPMYKAKARELMPKCQSAIPVWIMPLNRVVENFNPKNNKFDVIIIDEASQASILALAALYLAKRVIIVGDDEQVSPEVVGIKIDEVNALAAQHLEKIPNNHLYNAQISLYDMAKQSGFKPLMLTEHFRCLPEIIGFSNELSYNGRIKPLRDASTVAIRPAVVDERVSNGFRNGKKINEPEADHIVSLIQAMIAHDTYRGQTIGVISMLGNEQSEIIDRKLQGIIDPVVYEERRIQCGTPPQFQGDERDIIILSLVDSPNEKGGPLRLLSEDGKFDMYRKRYNVAVSRARNQLWVVHSLNPDIDLKADDLRLKLIKYAMNPKRDNDQQLSLAESPFETEVMQYLLNKQYKIISQFKVGAYRIDMVIQYGDKKVALECDGERFHTDEHLDSDLARQAILERLGWRFIRIRGGAYYRNPEETMNEVVDLLEKYGILPTYEIDESQTVLEQDLLNQIRLKARMIRIGRDEDTENGSLEGLIEIVEPIGVIEPEEWIAVAEEATGEQNSTSISVDFVAVQYEQSSLETIEVEDVTVQTSSELPMECLIVENVMKQISIEDVNAQNKPDQNVTGSDNVARFKFDFAHKSSVRQPVEKSKQTIKEPKKETKLVQSNLGLSKPKFDFSKKD